MSASVFDLNRDEDYDDDSFERARVNEKTEVVKAWFSSRLSYSYESVLGSGANGVAWLLVQAAQDGSQGRKFVMKRSMEDRDAISQLRNEIKVLRLLAGSQHIVQIIPSLDLEDDAEFRRELTLITEYLPNGTLDRLITRLESRSNYVPNRLLWRVFLCLIKASIALAYPHQSRGNRPEEWPSGTALTLPIVHGDIHAKNVAFGELDAGEHNLVPIAKLIDFGCADIFDLTDEDDKGIFRDMHYARTNTFNIGEMMYDLIGKHWSDIQEGDPTRRLQFAGGECNTFAMTLFQEKSSKTEDPFLDADLAVLVARCLSDKVATQPQLSELAAKASSAIQNRNWEHYSRRQFESDNWIREKLKEVMYDAWEEEE